MGLQAMRQTKIGRGLAGCASVIAFATGTASANEVQPITYAEHNCPANSGTIDPATGQPTSFEIQGQVRVTKVPIGSKVHGVYTIYAGREGGRATNLQGIENTYEADQPMISGTFTTEERTRDDADGVVEANFKTTRLRSIYAVGTYIRVTEARVSPKNEKITFVPSPTVDLKCQPAPPPPPPPPPGKTQEKCPVTVGAMIGSLETREQVTETRSSLVAWAVRSQGPLLLTVPEIKMSLPKDAYVVGKLDPRLDVNRGRFITLDQDVFSPNWTFTPGRTLSGSFRIAFRKNTVLRKPVTRTITLEAQAEQKVLDPKLNCTPAKALALDRMRVFRLPAGSTKKRDPIVTG